MTQRSLILSLAVAAALALPATASAATVTSAGGIATFTAASGEANHLTVAAASGGTLEFNDTGIASMTAGSGCSAVAAQRVRCPVAGLTSVVVDAGDGNDYVAASVLAPAFTIYGGLGNDQLTGSLAGDQIDGGAGNDTINGNWGDDTIDGAEGADAIGGSYGRDTVTYASRTAAVSASLDGVANDGETGEGDNLTASVDNLVGGAGSDTLTGDAGTNALQGGAGDDTLAGLAGDDSLDGGTGRDGFDGGADVDSVKARDGVAEAVVCGSEADTVEADYDDAADADCEVVDRSAAPPVVVDPPTIPPAETGGTGNVIEAPVAAIAPTAVPVTDDGVATVRLKCPKEAFEGCSGSLLIEGLDATGTRSSKLDVHSARRRPKLASRRFKVAAGEGKTLPVRFDRRAWRKFKGRRRAKIQITVTMDTPTGTTTNTRIVALRRVHKPKRGKRH